ncbi:MAG: DUF4105 domain-containing protein [Acidobacteriota bacterium]
MQRSVGLSQPVRVVPKRLQPRRGSILNLSVLALACLLWGGNAGAAPARIELVTVGPGEDILSKFGHASLCVFEQERPQGECYNYGTADFSTPVPLTWEVLRARARFWVSVTSYERMVAFYQGEDRTIYRQGLPLSVEQAEKMTKRLRANALPESRFYVYNHFHDNCTTRPRDHIDTATDGALSRATESAYPRTYRELIHEALGHDPLLGIASELLLGRFVDGEISTYQAMFLPAVLRQAVRQHLGAAPEVVYRREAPLPGGDPEAPLRRLWGLALGLGLTAGVALLFGSEAVSRWAHIGSGMALGVMGTSLVFVAVVSPLPEIRYNELLLVYVPADFMLLRSGSPALRIYLATRLAGLMVVASLAAAGTLLQPLWAPWSLAVLVLAAMSFKERRLKTKSA